MIKGVQKRAVRGLQRRASCSPYHISKVQGPWAPSLEHPDVNNGNPSRSMEVILDGYGLSSDQRSELFEMAGGQASAVVVSAYKHANMLGMRGNEEGTLPVNRVLFIQLLKYLASYLNGQHNGGAHIGIWGEDLLVPMTVSGAEDLVPFRHLGELVATVGRDVLARIGGHDRLGNGIVNDT
ncbi:hypothetical protein HYY71_07315 [Candidatus Woesearchaeota archaeon]|nr:hypothetical protein [Candidatus Woesearchaeota archaeon]